MNASELEAMLTEVLQRVAENKETQTADRFLTVAQAAEMLGVSRTTLWRWSKIKFLVPTRLGNSLRYKESELQKYVCHE